MPGITPEGFDRKTQETTVSELQQFERDNIDPQIEYDDEDPLGQINGVVSGPIAELWELAEELYHSLDAENAEGDALENVGALVGVPRGEASRSVSFCTLDIDLGEVVPAGAIIAVEDQEEIRFLLVEEQTGEASPLENVRFEAENVGRVQAAAGSLTVIVTPFTGWNSVTNPEDASPGDEIETFTSYRKTIAARRSQRGGSTVDAVVAAVLALNDTLPGRPILDAQGFENVTLVTDANGLPGKAIEILVHDQEMVEDTVIAQAIWESKPGGIRTFGNVDSTAIDAKEVTRNVSFSRPEPVDIIVTFEIEVDPGKYAGDVAFKQKVVDMCTEEYGQGEDVIGVFVKSTALQTIGVKNVTAFGMHRDADPDVETRINLSIREIAAWDTADVTVTTSNFVDV